MLHIKLIGVKNASIWSEIFWLQPPSHDHEDGINRSKFNLFQNLVIVTYQIKGITKCSNTVATVIMKRRRTGGPDQQINLRSDKNCQDTLSGMKFASKSRCLGRSIQWETLCFNWPIKKQYWKTVYRQSIYYLLHCHGYCVINAGTSPSVIGIRDL